VTDTDFQRYLAAKRTVDDRGLDRRLVDRLRDGLAERAGEGPLRVVEVGAGLGTMVERLLEWDVLPPGRTEYAAVDVDADNVAALRERLPTWAKDHDVAVTAEGDTVRLVDDARTVVVEPVAAEATAYLAERDHDDTGADAEGGADLLAGVALLDILGLDALPALLDGVAPGGWWYFPVTFDGATRFAPAHPADRAVERAYHRHMDRKPGGDSRAGTHALGWLREADRTVGVDAAGSDWAVRPVDGAYPGDEAYVIRHVLATVEDAVGEVTGPGFRGTLREWLDCRRRQLAGAELVYTTHQLDLLGRVSDQ
jgi:hypothetical protein